MVLTEIVIVSTGGGGHRNLREGFFGITFYRFAVLSVCTSTLFEVHVKKEATLVGRLCVNNALSNKREKRNELPQNTQYQKPDSYNFYLLLALSCE